MQHRPRKRFGQHFLHNQAILKRMIAAIAVQAGEHVVEIGPGKGALTEHLLVIPEIRCDVVEIDRDLVAWLPERFPSLSHEQIHNIDALAFDFRSLVTAGQQLRVVGNLPYNISTPLLFHLISQLDVIHDMHFLLQKEVVDRLCAQPADANYGRLSVMTQYYCHARRLFNVGPSAFKPPPKVDSAYVRLVPHQELPCVAADVTLLQAIVKAAFAQRRKTLRNSLRDYVDDAVFQTAEIDPQLRAERLSVGDFVTLTNLVASKR